MNTILLHGALGAQQQLYDLRNKLQQAGHTTYTVNFPGHGGRNIEPSFFGIEAFAEDLENQIVSQHIHPVQLFGYSMGGYVALWLAHRKPELVQRVVTLGTKFDWDPDSALRETQKLDVEKIKAKVPAFARLMKHRHEPADWTELVRHTNRMMIQLGDHPLLTNEKLEQITTQTLILLGDLDNMADRSYSEQVAHLLPNGTFQLLSDTPHPIEKVDSRRLTEYLRNFF